VVVANIQMTALKTEVEKGCEQQLDMGWSVLTPFEKCAVLRVCTILLKGNWVNIPEPEHISGTKVATQTNLETPVGALGRILFSS